jgi:hypothetical protein
MHDAFGVRGVERVGGIDSQRQQRFDFHRASGDGVLQRLPVETLHGDEGGPGFLADVVNGANVGMVQRGCRFGFAAKTFEGLPVLRQILRQKFQRDKSVEPGVLRLVDHAHATATKFFGDAVMRNGLADQGLGVRHVRLILWCDLRSVNATTSRAFLVLRVPTRPAFGRVGIWTLI